MLITIIQIIIAVLLMTAILLQQRGAGLSGAFGGGEGGAYSTRRGIEKLLFTSTIILAILFFGVSIVRLLV